MIGGNRTRGIWKSPGAGRESSGQSTASTLDLVKRSDMGGGGEGDPQRGARERGAKRGRQKREHIAETVGLQGIGKLGYESL